MMRPLIAVKMSHNGTMHLRPHIAIITVRCSTYKQPFYGLDFTSNKIRLLVARGTKFLGVNTNETR